MDATTKGFIQTKRGTKMKTAKPKVAEAVAQLFSLFAEGKIDKWECYPKCWEYLDSRRITLTQICRIGASYDIPEGVIRMRRADYLTESVTRLDVEN
jgi:hypothetical protein